MYFSLYKYVYFEGSVETLVIFCSVSMCMLFGGQGSMFTPTVDNIYLRQYPKKLNSNNITAINIF